MKIWQKVEIPELCPQPIRCGPQKQRIKTGSECSSGSSGVWLKVLGRPCRHGDRPVVYETQRRVFCPLSLP